VHLALLAHQQPSPTHRRGLFSPLLGWLQLPIPDAASPPANSGCFYSFQGSQSSESIQTSETAFKTLAEFLSTCPTENYAVVTQPGVHYSDFSSKDGATMRNLWHIVEGHKAVKGKMIVPEVVGGFESLKIADSIKAACDQANKQIDTTYLDLPYLPTGEITAESPRGSALLRNGENIP
jgi:hypothetical protein